MESNNIMGLVAAFIGVAIIIGIGAQILGNSVSDCTTFPDYSVGEVSSVAITLGGNYTTAPTVAFSGDGTLATGTVTAGAIANGFEVLSVTVVEGGQGYTTATASFNGGAPVTTPATADVTVTSVTEQTGWAGECMSINAQTQTAFALLVIVLIVIAAVIILSVVKML
jgi:hypothetical protein